MRIACPLPHEVAQLLTSWGLNTPLAYEFCPPPYLMRLFTAYLMRLPAYLMRLPRLPHEVAPLTSWGCPAYLMRLPAYLMRLPRLPHEVARLPHEVSPLTSWSCPRLPHEVAPLTSWGCSAYLIHSPDDGLHGSIARPIHSLAIISGPPWGAVDVYEVGLMAHAVGLNEVRHVGLVQHADSWTDMQKNALNIMH